MTAAQVTAKEPSAEPPLGPRPFSEIPSLWLRVFKMDEDFFASELPRASHIGVLLSAVIVSGAVALIALITSQTVKLFLGVGFVPSTLSGLWAAGTGFYASAGVTFLCARILGGKGGFKGQAYLQSLYSVPVGIVQYAAGFVPIVGRPLAILATLYGIVLGVRAVKVSHKLTTDRATVAVLGPIALVVVLVIVLLVKLFYFSGDTVFM
jgi:hypothetical protein